MFIKLFDSKNQVNMLLALTEVLAVKEYLPGDDKIPNTKSVVMTRPLGEDSTKSFNYYVSESVDEIETLITTSLSMETF